MLPVAHGANGHPPIRPTVALDDESTLCRTVQALANPVLRVFWACSPTGLSDPIRWAAGGPR